MRKVTPQEVKEWVELAEAHGHTDAHGNVAPGRFTVSQERPGEYVLTLVTPLPAPPRTPDLRRKTPPIMFDRTPDGDIVLPLGRWLDFMFEEASRDQPPEGRMLARALSRAAFTAGDAILPAETDTIEFVLPDEDGNPVVVEALPPGGHITIRLKPEEAK